MEKIKMPHPETLQPEDIRAEVRLVLPKPGKGSFAISYPTEVQGQTTTKDLALTLRMFAKAIEVLSKLVEQAVLQEPSRIIPINRPLPPNMRGHDG